MKARKNFFTLLSPLRRDVGKGTWAPWDNNAQSGRGIIPRMNCPHEISPKKPPAGRRRNLERKDSGRKTKMIISLVPRVACPWLSGIIVDGILAANRSAISGQTFSRAAFFHLVLVFKLVNHKSCCNQGVSLATWASSFWYCSLSAPGHKCRP